MYMLAGCARREGLHIPGQARRMVLDHRRSILPPIWRPTLPRTPNWAKDNGKAPPAYLSHPSSKLHTNITLLQVAIETGSEVEWSTEVNYHFRLSEFREKLLAFYAENPTWISPPHRMKEVVDSVTAGLSDLSISRPSSRLSWGIPVPSDPSQTIYVWLDALMNYVSVTGYGKSNSGELSARGWPADIHVIGKDIVRFHCIYWPAFLMALELPLPKHILTHGHWLLGSAKMSKSTGTVVNPFEAIERFGSDALRFFLAHEGALQQDSSYDNRHVLKLYNSFMRGSFGNLAARVMRSQLWSVKGSIERIGDSLASLCAEGPGSKFYNNTLLPLTSEVVAALDQGDFKSAARQMAFCVNSVCI